MKVNFKGVLWGTDKKPLKDGEKELNMGIALVNALMADYGQREQNLSGIEKYNRYKLARKIDEAAGEVDLKAEEIVVLKGVVEKAYSPLILGQLYDVLEPQESVDKA